MTREILKCSECGKLATHGCERSGQWICGAPLCDDETCIEKHIRRVHPQYLKDWSVERMKDLISRKALLKDIKGMFLCDTKTRDWVVDIIQHQPTAYDVEKVVEGLELENKRLKTLKNNCIALCDHEVIGIENKAYDYAIKIVRNGGQKLDWSVEE